MGIWFDQLSGMLTVTSRTFEATFTHPVSMFVPKFSRYLWVYVVLSGLIVSLAVPPPVTLFGKLAVLLSR